MAWRRHFCPSQGGGLLLLWLLPALLKGQLDNVEGPRPCEKTPLRISCRGRRLPAFPQGLGRDVQQLDLALNSITSLADGDTAGLELLQHLDLSSNWLQAVSAQALAPLVHLRTLSLAANRLHWNHTANGKAFLSLGSLEALDLSGNHLDSNMAASYLGYLPSLQELDLSWNQVTQLSRGIFRGVLTVREINLKNNHIAAIEEGSLDALKALRVLDLAMNFLRCISGFHLPQVQVLNLSHNALESFVARGEVRGVYQLQVLDLSHNRLTSLPLLPRRNRLLYLNLSHNAIAHLAANATRTEDLAPWSSRQAGLSVGQSFWDATLGLAQILVLDLSSNQLSAFPVSFLHTLNSLHTLSLATNCIRGMEVEQPTRCHWPGHAASGREPAEVLSVKKLDLQGNLLHSLPRCFFALMPHLESVDLSRNYIQLCRAPPSSKREGPSGEGSSCTAFHRAPQLRHLSLRGNQLAIMHSYLFSHTALSSLDLSENEGLVIPEGALEGLESSLQMLFLKGNQMRISDLNLPCLGALKSVDLSQNQLRSLPPALLCSPLEKLDIRQNNLRSLEIATAAKLAHTLRNLTLAGNPFSCCELRGLKVILGVAAVTVWDLEDTHCSYHDGQKNVTARLTHRHAWPCPRRLRRDYPTALAGVAAGLLCSLCLACATCCLQKAAKGRVLLHLGLSSRVQPTPYQSEEATSGPSSADESTKV
ncbi:transforming growth factor beta activator LRRC32-like [Tiliqua scincoides]|uniref:transforming growth factor beta activator LRRC32-like n=1 Tax=Tiliqua scincoides TaxID=71010 RepID=UPI003461866E